jgi:hypothetical protein
MTTKKKTANKSTRSKVAANLTMDALRELPHNTELELTVRVKLQGAYTTTFEIADSEGDEFTFCYSDVISARVAPPSKVKVSGEGADRAAEILREKGFDVS